MGCISRGSVLAIILVSVVSSLLMVSTMPVGVAQAGTNQNGIIASDTTWTKANSPYILTGPVGISQGITLTIEPGTILNLNGNYLQVNGTLQAIGTKSEPISIEGNSQNLNIMGIDFTSFSADWNEQDGSGSIIENAIITSIEISINGTSPKINNNTLIDSYIYSHITGSPIVTNNNITGAITYGTAITGGESSLIANNVISDQHDIAILAYSSTVVENNTVVGVRAKGINADESYVLNNTVSGCTEWGISAVSDATIERNTIINNYEGLVSRGNSNLVYNNTIANNTIGIYLYNPANINYNNIENNMQYSIQLDITEKYNVNATYNWWGTTDTQIINQSIFDIKNNFNLGNVSFVPFLAEPNPQAVPSTNAPLPIPSVLPTSPSPTPTISEFSSLTIPLAFFIAIAVAAFFKRKATK
jgi:hypothetical protein